MALVTLPALATENATVADKVNAQVAKTEQIADKFETSNPKIKFPHGLQLGIGISPTSGINGFVGYNNKNFDSFWAKRFGVRFDMASYSPIKSKLNKEINEMAGKGEDGVEIGDMKIENFALDGKHYGAMIDFYPFGNTWFLGGWRLSGGYFNGKLNLTADITDKSTSGTYTFELNGVEYTYTAGSLHGKSKVNWNYSGPYVGTGFDLGLFWGFKIYFDAGVVLADKSAKADLDIPLTGLEVGGTPVQNNATLETALKNNIKAELKDIQDDLDKYDYFPLVKLGFMYRF